MRVFKALALVAAMIPGSAFAATFNGEVYDVLINNRLSDADAYLADDSNTSVVTFSSETLGRIEGNSLITVRAALTTAGYANEGNLTKRFNNTLFTFSGFVDLGAMAHTFRISANDGFRLTIADTVVLSSDTQGTRQADFVTGDGPQKVEIVYFNNANAGFFDFTIDGNRASAVDGPVVVNEVPLPAGLPLLLGAIGAVAFLRRRKSA